ncbi:MAG: Holliday junction branch migration DNA helicase RuvB, partial [Candidatus Omnitrophica bacterium]|nr:Holliday junction branch migration DNA helicase RuvB [Candidatus Omnitrophota bacterium]
LLTSPLRSRFGIFFNLDFYKAEDLAKIAKNSARLLNIEIEESACLEIACRSRGTPRIANRLLRRVRDYMQVRKKRVIDRELASSALDELGIDSAGLDELDRKVLKTIIEVYNGGPVGIEAVAASLNEEVDTLVDTVEPYLLKAGYIKRSSRGRIATKLAYEHLKIDYPHQKQTNLFERES